MLGRFGVRSGKQNAEGGDVRQARPNLLAIQDPGIAVGDRSCGQTGQVRTGSRFGEQLAPDLLMTGDGREVAGLLSSRFPSASGLDQPGRHLPDCGRSAFGSGRGSGRWPLRWRGQLRVRRTRPPSSGPGTRPQRWRAHTSSGSTERRAANRASRSSWSTAATHRSGSCARKYCSAPRRRHRHPPACPASAPLTATSAPASR